MACSFTIEFKYPPENLVNQIKQQLEGAGGTFAGNINSGNFTVPILGSKIGGSYTINGQQMDINITDKPFLVPCSQIERYIKSNLG